MHVQCGNWGAWFCPGVYLHWGHFLSGRDGEEPWRSRKETGSSTTIPCFATCFLCALLTMGWLHFPESTIWSLSKMGAESMKEQQGCGEQLSSSGIESSVPCWTIRLWRNHLDPAPSSKHEDSPFPLSRCFCPMLWFLFQIRATGHFPTCRPSPNCQGRQPRLQLVPGEPSSGLTQLWRPHLATGFPVWNICVSFCWALSWHKITGQWALSVSGLSSSLILRRPLCRFPFLGRRLMKPLEKSHNLWVLLAIFLHIPSRDSLRPHPWALLQLLQTLHQTCPSHAKWQRGLWTHSRNPTACSFAAQKI